MTTRTVRGVTLGLALAGTACGGAGSSEDSAQTGQAIAGGSIDADDVMSDADLTGAQSVSAAQVESFLKSKGSALASYKDPGTGDSAATIIATLAEKHGISPVYILARIETESGLVESGNLDYLDSATGCGCPDSAVCNPKDGGFFNQISCGATVVRGYLDDLSSKGETVSGWRVGAAKDTSDPCSITPANAATAAMYTYTPWVGQYSTRSCGRDGIGGTSLMATLYRRYAPGFPTAPPTPVPPKPTACGVIEPGHGLKAGESLESCDGRFELAMKTDGNLVWSGPPGAMWSTDTDGKGGDVAVMQTDGNFVLYDSRSSALWASHTDKHDGDHLALQDDGNLVVYDTAGKALWASNTELPKPPPAAVGCGLVESGQGLTMGESFSSCGDEYTLSMQTDGNLVLYQNHPRKALWATGTEGKGGFNAVMQTNGNFVLTDWHDKVLWDSKTNGHPGADLWVQTVGNLAVYEKVACGNGADCVASLWVSNDAPK